MTNDVSSCENCTGHLSDFVQQLGGVWNNIDIVAVTKCWYQWIHFCGVLVQQFCITIGESAEDSDRLVDEHGCFWRFRMELPLPEPNPLGFLLTLLSLLGTQWQNTVTFALKA